jgi:glutamate synthase domain-containing protein 2
MLNVGREAMLAIGCIQAQECHTGHCPTGVATQSQWRMRGLDPTLKSARLANYLVALRMELQHLANACGYAHPALVPLEHIAIIDDQFGSRSARDVFAYQPGWGVPGR